MNAPLKPARAAAAWDSPSWRTAACDYHATRGDRRALVALEPNRLAGLRRLLDPDVSIDHAWSFNTIKGRAAARTVEALMFALRRGLGVIKHPDNQRRLSTLNDEQMREVAARVQKFMPHIAPAWESADVEALISVWSKLRC